MRRADLVLVVLFLVPPWPLLDGARPPLVHIQTDRPAYRLGETIWYRVHAEAPGPLAVRLLEPDGREVERADLDGRGKPASGAFFIPPRLAGGAFVLEARTDGRIGHRVAVEVYELAMPELDLGLTVLGEGRCPGEPVTAAFHARDLQGRPLAGEQVEYLATFGSIRIRGRAGVTDADGRAVVRFVLPAAVRESGHLSVGVAAKKGKDAVSRRVAVTSSVGSIEAFPEGGTVVEGHPQRMGLLVRDREGRPVPAEGRILDDLGRCVGGFRSDRWGLGQAIVPCEVGRRYQAAVDRPAGIAARFPLPPATGHDHAVFVDRTAEGFEVEVRGSERTEHQVLGLRLVAGGREVVRGDVTLRRPPKRSGGGAGERSTKPLPRGRLAMRAAGIEGIGHILVLRDDRPIIDRPVYLGVKPPIAVTIKPRKDVPFLSGKGVELEVLTTRGGRPIAAELAVSVYQGDPSGIPDFAARSILEPELAGDFQLPQDFPALTGDPEAVEESFLLVHGASGTPPAKPLQGPAEGEGPGGSPPAAHAEAEDPEADAPRGTAGSAGRTVARLPGLERLLERASFTRSARPDPADHRVELLASAGAILATPGLGKPGRTPPQDVAVPAGGVDSRRGLFWTDRLKTDGQGRAAIRLKLNDLVSDLTWVAQGRAGALPVSACGTLSPDPGFRSLFKSPDHLHVGDALDILLEARVTDGSREEVVVDFQAPACLRPTLRTRLDYDPRKDATLHKFSFLAAAPSEEAEFWVSARRGMYREVHVRPVRIHDRKVELTRGVSGRDTGLRTFSLDVPREAVPGSVRVHGTVSTRDLGDFLEWLRRLLRLPTGCFEQYTSQNYVNLVVLEALLEGGEDAGVLERAYLLAEEGFRALLVYRDRETGGFSMFPHRPAEVRSTVIALRHLVLYEKLFAGRGARELEAALSWLEGQREVDPREAMYLTLFLHQSGRTWKGSRSIEELKASTPYEMALQASCLADWPASKEEPAARALRREKCLRTLLDALKDLSARDPRLGEAGVGLMGSRGGQLSVETLSLYAMALDGAGRGAEARGLIDDIVDLQGRFLGTHSTALAIHALSRLGPPSPGELLQVEFSAPGGRPERIAALPGRIQPILFDRPAAARPGEKASVSVDIQSADPRPYSLALSYLLEAPRSSPDAPYRLRQRITPCVDMESTAEIRLRIEPAGRPVDSQVVARIGLPGGCIAVAEEMARLTGCRSLGFWAMEEGYLDLYWPQGPREPVDLVIPVRAEIAGSFAARPSLIYPYYETGRESYADPLAIKVLNTFGAKVKPEDLLDGRGRGPKSSPPGGQGTGGRGKPAGKRP